MHLSFCHEAEIDANAEKCDVEQGILRVQYAPAHVDVNTDRSESGRQPHASQSRCLHDFELLNFQGGGLLVLLKVA